MRYLTLGLFVLFIAFHAIAENSNIEFPTSVKGLATFSLPDGWVIYEENELEKKAQNEAIDAYWKVEAEYKEDYVSEDPKDYLKTLLGNFKGNLLDMKASEIRDVRVDGKTAYSVEVVGGFKTGLKYTYHLTALDAGDKFLVFMGWAPPSKFRKYKEQMIAISHSVKWQKK